MTAFYSLLNHNEFEDIKEDFNGVRMKYFAVKERSENILNKALKIIRVDMDRSDFSLSCIPIDDPNTYVFLSKGNTKGLFEFDSKNCSRVLNDLKPSNFNELLNAVILSQPYRFEYMFDEYLEWVQGKKKISHVVPEIAPFFEGTFGYALYNEQFENIAIELAGFDQNTARSFVIALKKKKLGELVKLRSQFAVLLSQKMSLDEGNALFDWLEEQSCALVSKKYFIESVTTSYRMAWLKVNFSDELDQAMKCIDA